MIHDAPSDLDPTRGRARAHATVALLVREEAIRFGNFTLKDGSRSPLFVDLGAVSTGAGLGELGDLFAQAVQTRFGTADWLFGPAYKGLPIATSTAIALGRRGHHVRTFFDRKEAKAHGEGGLFIGQSPPAHARIVVLDDVITSGATKVVAFNAIEQAFHARPLGVVVAVDRRPVRQAETFPLEALATLDDVATYLRETRHPQADAVQRFVGGLP
jgi:orotate phosphoribosyltransferase